MSNSEGKQASGATTDKRVRLAKAISLALHPFLVAPVAIVLVLFLESDDLLAALWWATVCGILVVAPLVGYLSYKLARKQLTDADISVREERTGIYIFGTVCLVACLIILEWLNAPEMLLTLLLSGLAVVFVFALVTRFATKVSVHTGIMTAVAVASGFFSWPWAIALGAGTALVGWSRLVLKRHTPVEVISGILIAGGTFFLVMYLR